MKRYTDKKPKDWTDRQKAEWQKDVGKRLREVIEDVYGYRQEYRFAKEVGISQGSLSDILNGKSTPSAYTLIKIESAIGFKADTILGGF